MFSSLMLAAAIAAPANSPLSCAVMGSPTNDKSPAIMASGIRFPVCCPGCDGKLKKETAKYFEASVKAGKTVGEFLFDPVSRDRILAEDARSSMDYKGLRYHFSTTANLNTFKADPAKFAKKPAKETLFCVVMEEKIKTYDEADSYVDHEGVRYYMCCSDCKVKFQKDPKPYLSKTKPVAAAIFTKEEK
jgi:YHS domain-containing protein